jgi:hypothetical protein
MLAQRHPPPARSMQLEERESYEEQRPQRQIKSANTSQEIVLQGKSHHTRIRAEVKQRRIAARPSKVEEQGGQQGDWSDDESEGLKCRTQPAPFLVGGVDMALSHTHVISSLLNSKATRRILVSHPFGSLGTQPEQRTNRPIR